MTWHCKRRQTPWADIIEIEGLGLVQSNKACELAAQLTFLADGNMITRIDKGKITGWNEESPLLQAYRKLFESGC